MVTAEQWWQVVSKKLIEACGYREVGENGYIGFIPIASVKKLASFLSDEYLDERGERGPSLRHIIDSAKWIKGIEVIYYPWFENVSMLISGVYVKKKNLADLVSNWIKMGICFPEVCIWDYERQAFWLSWLTQDRGQPAEPSPESLRLFYETANIASVISEVFGKDAVVVYDLNEENDFMSICLNLKHEEKSFTTVVVDVNLQSYITFSLINNGECVFSRKIPVEDGARKSVWKRLKKASMSHFI